MEEKPSRLSPEGDFDVLCLLEQHEERIGAEFRTFFYTHDNSEFLFRKPFPDSWEIVSFRNERVSDSMG